MAMKSDFLLSPFFLSTVSAVAISLILLRWFRSGRQHKLILLENPEVKYTVSLIDKQDISWNVRLFRFNLPSKDHVLGLPTGQHLYLIAKIGGKTVIRPYTPVTSDDTHGHFDLVVKVYFKNQHPKYPEGGKMSQYLDEMALGSSLEVRGPNGNLIYNGLGEFAVRKSKTSSPVLSKYKKVGMIAGGTGITPMLQLVREVTKNPADNTQLWLVFANQTEDDILLRNELDEVQRDFPDRFRVWYTIETASPSWNFSVGYVTAEILQEHLPPPSDDTFIIMCGPPPMINLACTPNLDKLGYSTLTRFIY